jgi:4-alpha-glucanotransferase
MPAAPNAFRCRAFPQRSAGVLLHPTALPGPGPIGTLGAEAQRFIEALAAGGFTWWQVCPLGPTGYGDSPYQALSIFAGNPYLLDLGDLERRGYLTAAEVAGIHRGADQQTNYGRLWHELRPLLKRAGGRAAVALAHDARFLKFQTDQAAWLPAWCHFSALREQNGFTAPARWTASAADAILCAEAAALQFLFAEQWQALRAHAERHGIRLMGDEPIYVSADGCDVRAHPQLFQLDAHGRPTAVAGVPPDYFAEDGQLWGNPLYDWPAHAAEGFAWWRARVAHDLQLFDAVRIDHFRGLCDYWSVPADAPNARGGTWHDGPGLAFTLAMGDLPLVAEDLGLLSPGVDVLRKASGLPGMAVLQFGFGGSADNPHHPDNVTADRVVYTGTHDNDTLRGWLASATPEEQANLQELLGAVEDMPTALIDAVLRTAAVCAILPVQDLLGLGSTARFNTPGNPQGNWTWRLTDAEFAELTSTLPAWRPRLARSQRLNA